MSEPLKLKAEKRYPVSSAPYLRANTHVSSMYWWISVALIPIVTAGFIFFGWAAFGMIMTVLLTGLTAEAALRKMVKKKNSFADGSTASILLIFAVMLPPHLSWVVAALGSFCVVAGREAFGGLGQNFFNASQVGRAILLVLFPYAMLDSADVVQMSSGSLLTDLAGSGHVHFLAQSSPLALILAGLILFGKKLISWEAPFFYLVTIYIGSVITNAIMPGEMFQTAVLFCAFFLVTDSVSIPITRAGKAVFAVMAAVLTVALRPWFFISEGVTFAILTANALVPVIDWLIRGKH